MLRIGAWCVNPASGQISRDGETARLEARTMRLLLFLAEHAGEVVSIEDLLNQVWSGVIVTPDSVYQAVAGLRRLLGDDPRQPTYIATVPRLGYRMVAPVSSRPDDSIEDSSVVQTGEQTKAQTDASWASGCELGSGSVVAAKANSSPSGGGFRRDLTWGFSALLLISLGFVGAFAFFLHHKVASTNPVPAHAISPPPKSIAVLPFLDLTEGMKEEEFADGMTEELIDKFSQIPGFHVPAPTASFYFKGKKMPLPEIAKTLNVGYVLDGSVRKSGTKLRVAARLFCADSGYVIWSETYDRPYDDVLRVQDDIADKVTAALRASIEAEPEHHHDVGKDAMGGYH
jgi:TolB-like protein/DNA-binding winged helix-turn-helix (wHTH) protein